MKIPKQLQNTEFRFFLIGKDSKIPCEKRWNSENNYHFFSDKLLNHLKASGNYGLVCGFGNLIVIDFDNIHFYNSVADKLPPTFTVISAGKRLPHLYYLLVGDMFKKIAIRDSKGEILADIQADRCGIVGPGSKINRHWYNVNNNKNIAEIDRKQLTEAFGDVFKPKQMKQYTGPNADCPALVKRTIEALRELGVKQTGPKHFSCPFHKSNGEKNLSVMPSGRLYCFSCLSYWDSLASFIVNFEIFKQKRGDK